MRRPVFSAPELRTPATDLYVAYCDWLSAMDPVERLPQQRKFLGGRIAKYRMAGRLITRGLSQDTLAALRFVIKHLLPALWVNRREGGEDEPGQKVRQGKVLGQRDLEGRVIDVQSNLSSGGSEGPIGGGVAGAGNRPGGDGPEDLQ